MALNLLYADKKPDLVLSGINHGMNVADDVGYSGTIGAAMEAAIVDVPVEHTTAFFNARWILIVKSVGPQVLAIALDIQLTGTVRISIFLKPVWAQQKALKEQT